MNPLTPPPEDRLAVRDVLARYAWTLDTADLDGLLTLFTPDAEFIQKRGEATRRFSGHAAIRAFAAELCAMPWFRGRQHHLSGLDFREGAPGARWRARSYVLVSEWRAGRATVEFLGDYEDVCIRDAGRWLIARRLYRSWRTAPA